MSTENNYEQEAIELICAEVKHSAAALQGYLNTPREWNSIYTLAVRNTAESLRLKAEVGRLGERVRMAEHYFASPESFSNEEFQAVGAVVTDCPNYSGKVPYLDEVERIREEKWPKELTPELTHILGLMCFRFIGPAQLFRAAGYTIPEAAEDEQAFMLHRLLGFWFTHGKDWHLAALEDLRAIRSLSAAKEESRG